MKFSNLIIIHYRQTRKRRLKGLVLLCLFTIAIVMIHMAIYEQEMCYYNINVTKELFEERDDLYNISVWNMGASTAEGMEQFLEEIKRIDGVKLSGRFFNCNEMFVETKENISFLEHNQNIRDEMLQMTDPAFFDMYYVDRDLTYLLGLQELANGIRGDKIPVLVGYDYKEYFEIGDVYTNLEGITYQICGILSEGFRIPSTGLLNSMSPYEIMDNKVIALYDERVNPMHILTLNGANSIYCLIDGENVVQKIQQIADEAFIKININSINELLATYEVDNKWTFKTTQLFTSITVFAAFLAMISYSIIQIIIKKQEYGILFANGISLVEGIKLIAIENGLHQFGAFIIGTIVAAKKIEAMKYLYDVQTLAVFSEMVVWKTFFVVVLLFVGSVVIPAAVLGKMNTVELLGGTEL